MPSRFHIFSKNIIMKLIQLFILFIVSASVFSQQKILTGADRMEVYLPLIKGKVVAVYVNQTSVIGNTHLVDTLLKSGIQLKKIFSPEHGLSGTADAGENVNNLVYGKTGIPIVSLYGSKQKPSADDLKDVD